MAGQMIHAAGAGDQRLLRFQPAVSADAIRDGIRGFDIEVLNIDCANGQVFVSQQAFIIGCLVMFNQQDIAFEPPSMSGCSF